MSAAVRNKPSPTEAAKIVADALGLDDAKRVGIALASVAAEEVRHNPAFAARVRSLYATLAPTPSTKRGTTAKALVTDLVPIKHVHGFQLNPAAPVDPFLVYEAYGAQQLPKALDLFPLAKLKESAALVEARNPGTKPVNRSSKAAVIDYIVHYVMEDR
jgi:hypothetical protein